MPKGCHTMSQEKLIAAITEKVAAERSRVAMAVDDSQVVERTGRLFRDFSDSISSGDWRTLLPGRPILAEFASRTRLDLTRIKTSYIRLAAGKDDGPFSDIFQIFGSFIRPPSDVA
jgi:hypothetical protein